MPQLLTRKAALSDLPTLLRFEQGVITAERPFDSDIKPDPVHYYDIEELINASHIELVVAEVDGELIGCGYARIEKSRHFLRHPLHAYLGFMYVDPAHRGKGVNKKIIEALKQWALSRNIKELRLDVYEGNLPAVQAYEKAGFSKQLINMRMDI
ncbi:GNAT family N-acetyltransferase [Dyadobacter sp. NIV53]|uniref:GNAT family N-acetyltransferase n=1 Tax=Dyadobacter sp. NIV53 TaxID=2861765 RepID=UPI001C87D3E6|nr:GNAT family N-acetyltransferase [Dyadobacter sp. NIV53]